MHSNRPTSSYPMASRASHAVLALLYNISLLAGLVALPAALVTRQLGVPVPLHRVLDRLTRAYERSARARASSS